MTESLSLFQDFGSQLANGDAAADYRRKRLDVIVVTCDEVVLDFTGIRSANSSFINALVSGLIATHGPEVIEKITFKGCNPVLKVLVESAIELGLQKAAAKVV